MSRSLAPAGGDDCIRTPPELAQQIVAHFRPHGRIVDPCRGGGAFADLMPGCDWFEITEGRDFLAAAGHWDWAVTNPPWGRKFRPILEHCMQVADNVVLLANLNVWMTKVRLQAIKNAGFGIVEALAVDTPPPPWPQQGFQLAAVWIRRGWSGSWHITPMRR